MPAGLIGLALVEIVALDRIDTGLGLPALDIHTLGAGGAILGSLLCAAAVHVGSFWLLCLGTLALGAYFAWEIEKRAGFFGAMGLYASMLLVTMLYMGILFYHGNPEWRPVAAGYLGLLMMGGCFISVGLLISSMTKNQIVAGTLTFAVKYTLEKFGVEGLRAGDVVITNDPYTGGGTHLSDVSLIVPIFYDDELVAFSASKAHWTEVGGKDPGSWTTDATEVFQEGLQFPCVKLYEEGRPVQSLIDVIEANVRLPDMTLGDMYAQAAAPLRPAAGTPVAAPLAVPALPQLPALRSFAARHEVTPGSLAGRRPGGRPAAA